MQYFVTGATGFIGKRLVRKLLEKKGSVVYFLMRESSSDKLPALYEYWGVSKSRAIPVFGDLRSPKLGVSKDDIKQLNKNIDHFYHLAAIYDMLAAVLTIVIFSVYCIGSVWIQGKDEVLKE